MAGTILDQGFELMAFGMGTVFIFLSLLVFSTTAMSRLIARFFPEPIIEPTNTKRAPAPVATSSNAQTISAISAAIHQYKKNKQNPS